MSIFQEGDPAHIEWSAARAEYAVKCTGVFTTLEAAEGPLKLGAKGVTIFNSSADFLTRVCDKCESREV